MHSALRASLHNGAIGGYSKGRDPGHGGSWKQSLQKLNTFVFERYRRAKSISPFMLTFIRRLTPDKYKTTVDSWLQCRRTLCRWGRNLDDTFTSSVQVVRPRKGLRVRSGRVKIYRMLVYTVLSVHLAHL